MFTHDEINLICIYNTGSRIGLIRELTAMQAHLEPDEVELSMVTRSALQKLHIMTDEGNVSSEDGLAEQLQQLAVNLTVEYWFDNQLDILRIIDGSALEDYDGIEVEGEILLHKAAKRAFDELGIKKLPTVKALQSEYAELLSGKKKTYVEFVKARDEMKAVLSAKANVDRLLGEDKERQEKGHFQEK